MGSAAFRWLRCATASGRCGASEIEAFPIAVSKLRFPGMIHVGDITKLNGAELPPVDMITGGSPCQDLSVAGARAGLAGERSGLFMEQIRVIKEMRAADLRRGRTTEHIRPRYGVLENVPGAFSSGTPKGEDFRIVLEEFVRIAFDSVYVPRPYTGRWEPAGRILLGDSGEFLILNTGPAPRSGAAGSTLWSILEAQPHPRYFLTRKACAGIIRRASERDKSLPPQLRRALEIQAGLRGEGDCSQPMAFASNQRDEVCDLHNVAGTQGAQPGMKQQTFVASGVVTKGNGDCFPTEDAHTSLSGGGGQAGQGYPCVLCLNDQGGQFMNCSENITGSLRAQMNAHQPLILESNQDHAVVRKDGVSPTLPASMGIGGYVPMVYENHGIDSSIPVPTKWRLQFQPGAAPAAITFL